MLWKMRPTSPSQQMFLSVQSLFLFFFFFFLPRGWGTHVNFLKVLFNMGGGSWGLQTAPPLSPPASQPLSSQASLHPPPPLNLSPPLQLHPICLSLSPASPLSHQVSKHNSPKHKAVFPSRGGRKQETLYLLCVCV